MATYERRCRSGQVPAAIRRRRSTAAQLEPLGEQQSEVVEQQFAELGCVHEWFVRRAFVDQPTQHLIQSGLHVRGRRLTYTSRGMPSDSTSSSSSRRSPCRAPPSRSAAVDPDEDVGLSEVGPVEHLGWMRPSTQLEHDRRQAKLLDQDRAAPRSAANSPSVEEMEARHVGPRPIRVGLPADELSRISVVTPNLRSPAAVDISGVHVVRRSPPQWRANAACATSPSTDLRDRRTPLDHKFAAGCVTVPAGSGCRGSRPAGGATRRCTCRLAR